MLEQTFPYHERCEQMGIMDMLHVTPFVKLLDEIIQLNGANHPLISTRPFSGSIYLFHVSHNNSMVTNLGAKPMFESKDFPPDDDEGGVGSLNYSPCLVKPSMMVAMFPILFPFHGEP